MRTDIHNHTNNNEQNMNEWVNGLRQNNLESKQGGIGQGLDTSRVSSC